MMVGCIMRGGSGLDSACLLFVCEAREGERLSIGASCTIAGPICHRVDWRHSFGFVAVLGLFVFCSFCQRAACRTLE